MRNLISKFSIAAALLIATVSAFGQYYGDRPYRDRDPERQERAMFDRIRADLDRASAYPYASRDDRRRFDEARRELFDFESRFDQGRYDKHELDEAIDRLQRVVSRNSLDPRDRGVLSEDLRRMRDFREFRNHYYNRPYDYGFSR